ncbi:uncharacterized protein LOC143038313 [Oratosquilla oratoria]|uniref:uncharacterized protein LOC143038313 n=1 Tax=Oratosquilla oratoria TaxID=337810 RepID=UPI003F770FFA
MIHNHICDSRQGRIGDTFSVDCNTEGTEVLTIKCLADSIWDKDPLHPFCSLPPPSEGKLCPQCLTKVVWCLLTPMPANTVGKLHCYVGHKFLMNNTFYDTIELNCPADLTWIVHDRPCLPFAYLREPCTSDDQCLPNDSLALCITYVIIPETESPLLEETNSTTLTGETGTMVELSTLEHVQESTTTASTTRTELKTTETNSPTTTEKETKSTKTTKTKIESPTMTTSGTESTISLTKETELAMTTTGGTESTTLGLQTVTLCMCPRDTTVIYHLTCWPRRALDEDCNISKQCPFLSICLEGVCVCDEGAYRFEDKCLLFTTPSTTTQNSSTNPTLTSSMDTSSTLPPSTFSTTADISTNPDVTTIAEESTADTTEVQNSTTTLGPEISEEYISLKASFIVTKFRFASPKTSSTFTKFSLIFKNLAIDNPIPSEFWWEKLSRDDSGSNRAEYGVALWTPMNYVIVPQNKIYNNLIRQKSLIDIAYHQSLSAQNSGPSRIRGSKENQNRICNLQLTFMYLDQKSSAGMF